MTPTTVFRISTLFIATLALVAAPAAAQTAGPPSGNGVQPVLLAGNPDCTDLGYDFGFKIDSTPANGTYTLSSTDGVLIGGAPEDPGNSVTISNSDGSYFDWTSTLGMDAVLVKAGPNANVFHYAPESNGDTALHGPINPSNDSPYGVSHVEFCYDYEVDVSKTAQTTFTRTWHWSISKGVVPSSWSLFTGDSGTSQYTVVVDRTGYTDSDWAVSGTITVANGTPFDATITGVTDSISGFGAVAVDCGVSFPYVLTSGGSLSCSYGTPLPDGSSRTNTATASTDPAGIVGGNQGQAAVTFGSPTTVVNGTVNVVDTNGQSWGPVSNGASWQYDVTFACDGDEGSHANVATIVETGQSDDASVAVSCHDLTVTKDATTSYDRDWSWTLTKSADQSQLTLSPGQSFVVNYSVDLDATSVDSDWAVSGTITVTNNHPTKAAPLTAVIDSVDGVAASVSCPSLEVPAGGSLQCTYSADLSDGSSRTNTATATLQNTAYASDGTSTAAGTTDFTGTAPVTFGGPTNETDECVDVEDSLAGFLGTVCASEAPLEFIYPWEIGPYSSPDDCGQQEVVNTASFATNDTEATGDDIWTITVDVPCAFGCTLTPGYWKTHSEHGPAPYDDTWAQLPAGADTPFFLSGQSWYQVLWTPPKGNAYYILGHAYIATSLNFLDGASAPPEVLDAWNEATGLFETYTPAEIDELKGNRPPRPRFLELAGLLDMYNNGLVGPGHCSEDDTSGQ